jgi:hypothetical protein
MKVFFRKMHRWLGLAMALQIIAWMISGLYFAWFPIDTIRGSHLAPQQISLDPSLFSGLPSANTVSSVLERHFPQGYELSTASLVSHHGRLSWRLSGRAEGRPFTRLLDNSQSGFVPMLNEAEARRIAQEMIEGVSEAPKNPVLIESIEPGSEYRGRPLPAWRVDFTKPEGVHVYLDAWTGEVTARRTDRWRLFDFLWMLHIMDFDDRDDFNTLLLQSAAFLGLVIALSGVVFWFMTTPLFRRRRAVTENGKHPY